MPVTMSFGSPGMGIESNNRLGNRPVVRQSKIYRQNESGNAMKSLFGQDNLAWDPDQQQGVFEGRSVYDAESQGLMGSPPARQARRGVGACNSYAAQPSQAPPPQQQFYQPPPPQQQFYQQPPPQQQQQFSYGPPQAQTQFGSSSQQKKNLSFAPGTEGAVRGGGRVVAEPYGGEEEDQGAEYPLPGSTASCDVCGEVVSRFYHCQDCQEATGLFDLCTTCCAAAYLQQGPPGLLGRVRSLQHPTHAYSSHRMVHVTPPTGW